MHTLFWLENLRGRDHLEDLAINGKIILDRMLGKIGWEDVDWMHLSQDNDQWWALVNMVMNLYVP
jgi:hypothetical protein